VKQYDIMSATISLDNERIKHIGKNEHMQLFIYE
jgi:hypothetical protein